MSSRPATKRTSADDMLSLAALPFGPSPAGAMSRLTERQQHQLASMAVRLRFAARATIYKEESPASWVFIVGSGVVKSFRDLSSGHRRMAAFLFRDDIFGLAQQGFYVNTAESVTAATVYRIQLDALTDMLRRDAELQFRFLCKVTHQLRELQRRCIVLSRGDAVGRLTMFLDMLRNHTSQKGDDSRIDVPMSRLDIAEYLGLTPEAVTRATRALQQQHVLEFDDPHTARIHDRRSFERLLKTL